MPLASLASSAIIIYNYIKLVVSPGGVWFPFGDVQF